MSKPIKQDSVEIDLSNEKRLATVLRMSGKPWILDIMEAMETTGLEPDQLIQSIYLFGNIRRFARWGKVIWVIQDGRLTRVNQEQGFNYISKEK